LSRVSPDAVNELRHKGVGAAKLELIGQVVSQAVRLISSMILSRLLFPEEFGLSVIVGTACAGLTMLTNVGVSQGIVQHQRGDDPTFLNTGWTLLVVRGFVLWFAACLLAYPLSIVLREPALATLLPVGALSATITGLASTSLFTLRRHLIVLPLVKLEIYSQLLTVALNVAFAWYFRSVWGLIAAGLVGNLFTTLASHLMQVGYRNRFAWDGAAWSEIYTVGKWVQASSILSFVSLQIDRLLLVRLVDASTLGVYYFASTLAEAVSAAATRVTHGVLFPSLSQINRESPERLTDVYYRIRLRFDVLTLLPIGVLATLSNAIVELLFDPRYHAAGWMLQALCVRSAMSCTLVTMETYLFALAQTRYGFYRDMSRSLWVIIGIPLAWSAAGLQGLVWVVALSEIPVLLVLWTGFARVGALRVRREAIGPAAFGVGAVLGVAFHRLVIS
jgi:O-antigen/teichoic acid export membrane protein